MARPRLTGESSVSQELQQYSRPQRPTPEEAVAGVVERLAIAVFGEAIHLIEQLEEQGIGLAGLAR